jgi:azurin
MIMMRSLSLLFVFTLILAACGGADNAPASGDSSADGNADAASAEADRTVTIQPVGNEMRFETTEFSAAPGETIRIVFVNTATSPSMQHNVVVLNTNDNAVVERIGEEGLAAGSAADYVPDDPAVLAYTAIAPPGETVEVVFTVPSEPGDYRYICTFPGHWATMQGTMRVTQDPS